MALTADEKERIMQSRASERVATSTTKLYRPTVDGKKITLLALSGMNRDKAWAYCYGIFGKRLESLE